MVQAVRAAARRRQRARTRHALGVLVLVLLLSATRADALEWQPVGPAGGWIAALAVDPRRPDTVYAGMGRRGLYRSTNGGESWTLLGFPANSVSWIGFHPTERATLFVSSTDGMMRSPDSGKTWTRAGPPPGPIGLAFDPADPAVMYVGREGCVLRTTAGAHSERDWSPWCGGLPFGDAVCALFTLPGQPDALYALTATHGLLESLDRGESWHALAPTPQTADGKPTILANAALANTAPPVIYAATGWRPDEVFLIKSSDAGRRWQPAGTGLPEPPMALAVAPSDANIVYAVLSRGRFFTTRDGGAHWIAADAGLPTSLSTVVAVDPVRPQTVYVGTYGGGVWKTDDGGAAWRGVSAGLDASMVQTLVLAPWPRPTLFALLSGGGPFASEDGGRTWRTIMPGLPRSSADVMALAADPTRAGAVYIGTHTGLYASDDAGATWYPDSPFEVTDGVVAVAVDPTPPRSLYLGLTTGMLLRREGDGPWVSIHPRRAIDDGGWNATPLLLDHLQANTIYWDGATTRDGGSTWTKIAFLPAGFPYRLIGDPTCAHALYAVSWDGGVFLSPDGGTSWQPSGPGLPAKGVDAFVVDPRHPTTLYAASTGRIFVSYDRAAHWSPLDAAISDLPVLSLAIDAADPPSFYLGTEGRGVLKSRVPAPPVSP